MYRIALFLLCLILICCQSDDRNLDTTDSNLFEEVDTSFSGVDFENRLEFTSDFNIVDYLYFYNGGGTAVGDLDNDGLEDVYLTGNQVSDRLYKNLGGLTFEEISMSSDGDRATSWSTGVTMVDVNNDGKLDIYVCKLNKNNPNVHNELYINKGAMKFEEASAEYGLDFSGYSTQASFFDYDHDGDLDMYLANHSIHTVRSYGTIEKRKEKSPLFGDVFYENRLNEPVGKFVNVTDQAGIYSSALGYGLCLVASDINNDGWVDIYIGNDFHENDYLYINNGDKTFTESIKTYTTHTSKFTMGVDAMDMNQDGLVDLFSTDMLPDHPSIIMKSAGEESNQILNIKRDFGFENQYARNHFQLQHSDGHFSEVAYMTETYASDWSWSVLLQDFDNNGWNDIFITNGIVKRPNDLDYINYLNEVSFEGLNDEESVKLKNALINKMPTLKIPNKLFLNTKGTVYGNYKEETIGSSTFANGSAYSDLDNDGDLDLIVNNINQKATILENKSNGVSNYLSITLKGNAVAPNTIGTKCIVYANGSTYSRELLVSRGFQSSSTHVLHFGLGDITTIDSIKVIWPDGLFQIENRSSLNKRIEIRRSENLVEPETITEEKRYDALNVLSIKHTENIYLDYNQEVLIPEKLSREGPAILHMDLNQDGRKDIFMGGAMNQESRIYLLQADGSYSIAKNESFRRDAKYEDVDVATLDFDNDGDLDLYVVSGGGLGRELDKQLEDRIYMNMGGGDFIRYPLSLPHTNGSSVSTGDFDGDGYEDIFVGSRSIPGAYGLSPHSFLLRNVEGKIVEILLKERLGMITDSKAVDINKDGNLDLVLAGDWMPIKVLLNTGSGQFEEVTSAQGFSNSSGLWNCIEVLDVDEDGDMDIIAGNVGENFKWKASSNRPVKLYLHDFDENGQIDPIIFGNVKGENIPLFTKDLLVKQLPKLKKEFSSYVDFAGVRSLKDLTGLEEEEILETKKLTELRSMVYINQGDQFEGYPLPREAQLSDIQDFEIGDSSNKGREIKYVGNHLDYVGALGESSSNSGGSFGNFDISNHSFTSHNFLPLPKGLNSRVITAYGEHAYLIATNDGYLYILNE